MTADNDVPIVALDLSCSELSNSKTLRIRILFAILGRKGWDARGGAIINGCCCLLRYQRGRVLSNCSITPDKHKVKQDKSSYSWWIWSLTPWTETSSLARHTWWTKICLTFVCEWPSLSAVSSLTSILVSVPPTTWSLLWTFLNVSLFIYWVNTLELELSGHVHNMGKYNFQ